jgi:UDP-N-acetylmuramate dehydrogenase
MSIINALPKVRGEYRENFNLGKVAWFQTDGFVEVLFKPKDIEDLAHFLANKPKEIPYFVFGVGSNILIKGSVYKGVAIRLGREFNHISHNENFQITAGAGCLDLNVAFYSKDSGIGGLEFLSGIPGTIGGAVAMNAGAYGGEVKDILVEARGVDSNGNILNFSNADMGFKYRSNSVAKDVIWVSATFQGYKEDKEVINSKIIEIQNKRETTQPIRTKTSGSTFKNPEGHKAWQLIDEAGCRGLQIGGARVSDMHCNFFINTGEATSNDIEVLIQEVKKRVLDKSGILLKEEIFIIG